MRAGSLDGVWSGLAALGVVLLGRHHTQSRVEPGITVFVEPPGPKAEVGLLVVGPGAAVALERLGVVVEAVGAVVEVMQAAIAALAKEEDRLGEPRLDC